MIINNVNELTAEGMDQLFNPFHGIEFIYRYGLIFLDLAHLKSFEELTPGKLRVDIEWVPTVYMLTMTHEMRKKTVHYLSPKKRDIDWYGILSNDFSSGYIAAIYWAFGLWGGCSWGGWRDDNGKEIPKVDTISSAFSMDFKLIFIALVAQAYRWGLQGQIPALAKVLTEK